MTTLSIKPGVSVEVNTSKTTVCDFTETTIVKGIWVCNNSASTDIEFALWCDYDGTSSGDAEQLFSSKLIERKETLHITGLPDFASGGRITAQIKQGDSGDVTIHVKRAEVI